MGVVVVSLGSGDSTGKGLMKEKCVQLWLFNIIYATFVVVVTEFSCVSWSMVNWNALTLLDCVSSCCV